jgi:hypothetical protein
MSFGLHEAGITTLDAVVAPVPSEVVAASEVVTVVTAVVVTVAAEVGVAVTVCVSVLASLEVDSSLDALEVADDVALALVVAPLVPEYTTSLPWEEHAVTVSSNAAPEARRMLNGRRAIMGYSRVGEGCLRGSSPGTRPDHRERPWVTRSFAVRPGKRSSASGVDRRRNDGTHGWRSAA